MTNAEKIRTATLDELACFMVNVENHSIPVYRPWACNALNCIQCEEGLPCFKEWLNKEFQEVQDED